MQKTNISVKERIVFGIACIIAIAVGLLSIHAKDLVKYSVSATKEVNYRDVSSKAKADMHNHVEKQIMKTFQSFNDGSLVASRSRDDIDAFVEEDPGLWGRMSEQFYLWGVYLTMPFSRFV